MANRPTGTGFLTEANKGAANGVAPLGANGRTDASTLPAFAQTVVSPIDYLAASATPDAKTHRQRWADASAAQRRAAVQAAIFAAPWQPGVYNSPNGWVVRLPDGSWTIDDQIIMRPGVTVEGPGEHGTYVTASSAFPVGKAIFTCKETAGTSPDGQAHEHGNWTLRRFTVHGGYTLTPPSSTTFNRATTITGIDLATAEAALAGDLTDLNLTLEDLGVRNCSGRGIDMYMGRGGIKASRLHVQFCGYAGIATAKDSDYTALNIHHCYNEACLLIPSGSSRISDSKVWLAGTLRGFPESSTNATPVDRPLTEPQTPGVYLASFEVMISNLTAQNCYGHGAVLRGEGHSITINADGNNRAVFKNTTSGAWEYPDIHAYAGVDASGLGNSKLTVVSQNGAEQAGRIVGRQAHAMVLNTDSSNRQNNDITIVHRDGLGPTYFGKAVKPGSVLRARNKVTVNGKAYNHAAEPSDFVNLFPVTQIVGTTGTDSSFTGLTLDYGYGSPAHTTSRLTDAVMGGDPYVEMAWTADGTSTAGSYNGGITVGAGGKSVKVVPGHVYSVSGNFYTSRAGTFDVHIRFRNASATTTLETRVQTFTTTGPATVPILSDTFAEIGSEAPAGSYDAIILIRRVNDGNPWLTGDKLRFNHPMAGRTGILPPFADHTTPGWFPLGTANDSPSRGPALLAALV